MKSRVLSTLFPLLLLATTVPVVAQESTMKPVAVVAVPSYQNMLDDLKYVAGTTSVRGAETENNEQKFLTETGKLLGQLLQTGPLQLDGLQGISSDRPCGLVVATDDVLIAPLVFIPVDDFAAFLASAEPMFGEAVDNGEGLYEVGSGTLAGVVKEIDGWAYFAQLPDHLNLVADPLSLIGDLPEKYDLGVRLHVQNIPEVFRSFAIDYLQTMMRQTGDPLGLQQQMGQMPLHGLQRMLQEAESITLGMSVDEKEEKLIGEMLVQPQLGTRLASQIATLREAKTPFGGFSFDNQVLKAHLAAPLDAEHVNELTAAVDGYRADMLSLIEESSEVKSDEERDIFRDAVVQLTDEMKATIGTGRLDVAVSISGRKAPFSLVAAARTANGKSLEPLFERMVELADGDPGILEAKLNVAEHDGTPIHSMTLAPHRELDPIIKTFEGTLHVAFREDSIWLAMGPDAVDKLKQAMSGEEAEVEPLQVEVALTQIVRIMSQTIEDSNQRAVLTIMALNMGLASDRTTFNVSATEDGQLRMHGEMGKGLLRTIAVALPMVSQFSGGGAPGSGPPF